MRPSSQIESKPLDIDPEIREAAWEFILAEQSALERLCQLMSRGSSQLAEDLMCDVVYHYVPAAMNVWDPTKSSMRGHVMRSLKLYMWKYANYRFAPGESEVPEEHPSRDPTLELDLNDEVRYILENMPPYERSLLSMYHLCGMTHEEMAGVLEVSKGTARTHYNRALRMARNFVGYGQPDDD